MSQIQSIKLTYNNGKTETFSVYELSRWLSMVEAIDHLTEYSKIKHINTNNNVFKKPAAILNYINDTYSQYEDEILKAIQQTNRYDDSIFDKL